MTTPAQKLLWPEKRAGKQTIKVTGADSVLKIRDIEIRIPAGTPVDLLANINVYNAVQFPQVAAQLNQLLSDPQRLQRLVQILKNNGQYDRELKTIVPDLLKMNQSPDFIQDHGHTFGRELSDNEKNALIAYMKTF